MKHIGFLLHFYQPPTQDPEIVRRIDSECYRPLFRLLLETGVEATVNMNYSLTEQLALYAPETLEIVSQLSCCSFTSSGAYHPIFPLIPETEVKRQVKLNARGNGELIGKVFSPSGVFPPEMALDMKTIKLLGSMGFNWTVTDDVPWVHFRAEVPSRWIPSVDGTAVFLRSNFWSNLISFHGGCGSEMADRMAEDLQSWTGDDDSYIVVAMDGETFGHHRDGAINTFLGPFLNRIFLLDEIRISSFGRILNQFPVKESAIPSGSWSTTSDDLDAGEPFPLWNNSSNSDHRAYWKLLNFVLGECRKLPPKGVAQTVDKMLYSCPVWWASPGRESYSQVRRGVLTVIKAALECITERALLDRVMELAGRIPAVARKDM
jgi:alpha-amylase/alpha-mannosidase (GH57 family)